MKRYPLVEEVLTPLTTPEAFALFKDRRFSFFLDSGMYVEELSRYSFMGSDPFLVLSSRGEEITLWHQGREEVTRGNPFDILGELLSTYEMEPHPSSIPLVGGAVGYFSYDLCHFIERLPSTTIDDLQLPECYFAFYDCILAFDHLEDKVYIASSGFPEMEDNRRKRRAEQRLYEMRENLSAMQPPLSTNFLPHRNDDAVQESSLRSNFTHQQYLSAVETAREYIAAGDIFQVNLSQRFETDLTVPPYQLYRYLRHINPVPFAAYLNFDEVTIISASPERFLRVRGDWVETRPMKGTRPRGSTEAEDEALGRELTNSTKDRAENVMIVDLERNDLGRVCRFGTVKVSALWTLEKYATVFQLTSTVEGRLCQDKTRIDLLKACFPGGSITGAPKVRSMKIIDELEPTRRSVYTGAIGYLSFSGEMDLSMVIRTILAKKGKMYFQVGGGIVYDSEPEAEYQETLDKARALLQALSLSPKLEVVA
jgi:para-aminobenzoate synthetase component 1